MNSDYVDLKSLLNHRGYLKLQALWLHQYGEIMKGLKKVAAKNNEGNWKFKAGQIDGFDLATGQLEKALLDMEKAGETENPMPSDVDELLKEIKGE